MRWTLLWWELQYCNSVVISFFKEMYWFFHHIIFLCFPTFVVYTTGFPMRPIVSFCGSPTYQLFKYLTTILQPLTDKSRLQSKEDFINATKTVQILDDYKLVSFDVKSLFTSIPLQLALQFTETAILQSTDPLPTEYFIDLLNRYSYWVSSFCCCSRNCDATSRKAPFRLADKRYRFGYATLTILSPPYDTTKSTHSTTTLTNKTLTYSLLERSKKMVNYLF